MQWLVIVGFLVHLMFFYSIFDIYFTSPLVHGMTPHAASHQAPAKRLVLFVADGLRADKLFEVDKENNTRAPYLRDVVLNRGAWGVSHTRVPTESRPGHVALIAGFYEDVSAVAKGWKENPVEFDSVFNQSRSTWSLGSPDILPMFAKGASGDHVFTKMYPAESEDFAGADSSLLDTWVFDSVKDFLAEASSKDQTDKLQQDKVVLFLHLLGIDTNGHAHKPYSEEYLENIRVVDEGVRNTCAIIDEFYNHDGQTAFVLTSDHGMTNWGSHGAGHPSETLTPLVAWGAGVRGPQPSGSSQDYEDGFSNAWKLDHLKRTDVMQADIAPLMAALIGIAYPLNSVGTLPVDYLDTPEAHKAESLFVNARQILAQFEVKMAQKQETTLSALFTPYEKLTPSKQADTLRKIKSLLNDKKYSEVILKSNELIKLALEGLNYYHNYDRFFLGTSIATGYLGWMTYILILVLRDHTRLIPTQTKLDRLGDDNKLSDMVGQIIFLLIGASAVILLTVQSLPWTHYLYVLVPVALWYRVFSQRHVLISVVKVIQQQKKLLVALSTVVLWIIGIEIMVASFFHRGVLSIGLLVVAFWPWLTADTSSNKNTMYSWMLSCCCLAAFPMMPVVGRHANYSLVVLAGICGLIISIYCYLRPEVGMTGENITRKKRDLILFAVQSTALFIAISILRTTAHGISRKLGVPFISKAGSWTILGLSFILPLIGSTHMYQRLLSIAVSFLPSYLLLSTAHEGLFYITLCYLLFYWLKVEQAAAPAVTSRKIENMDFTEETSILESKRSLIMADLRCSYIFIFLLLTAFFGTGNIASINSFDLSSVYCFLTVFNPFVMGALMLWKIVIPFVLVTCTFSAIHLVLSVPTQSLFLIVLLMSDSLALNFFFLVRDYGSWLEIGTSISHYVIVMCLILFLLLLLGCSTVLTKYQLFRTKSDKSHAH